MSVLLTLTAGCSLNINSANSQSENNVTEKDVQTIATAQKVKIKIVELQDSKGLVYAGGEISSTDLQLYLTQLKHILGDEFSKFRKNQALRDHNTFHMTLVNPYEYRDLKTPMVFGDTFTVTLLGLGTVEKNVVLKAVVPNDVDKKDHNKHSTYFVVAESKEAQLFRQKLALAPKDFHVTLGFSPNDVFGLSKNKSTLIYKLPQ